MLANSVLQKIIGLFPTLSSSLRKGDCGRICVIGGSKVYTGAPYFAAITPIKLGADLVFLHCHPDAANVIKGFSPELIVNPSLNFDDIKTTLNRADGIVFGPGLGREKPLVLELLKSLLVFIKSTAKVLVIDADGLYFVPDCLSDLRGCRNVILTPNFREIERLYKSQLPNRSFKNTAEEVRLLAKELDVNIFCKGQQDVITDGRLVMIGSADTSSRRCGGQGDILSGTIALFVYWSYMKDGGHADGTMELKKEHIINGSLCASDFVRHTSLRTFSKIGRSMCASDIINEIPHFVMELETSSGN